MILEYLSTLGPFPVDHYRSGPPVVRVISGGEHGPAQAFWYLNAYTPEPYGVCVGFEPAGVVRDYCGTDVLHFVEVALASGPPVVLTFWVNSRTSRWELALLDMGGQEVGVLACPYGLRCEGESMRTQAQEDGNAGQVVVLIGGDTQVISPSHFRVTYALYSTQRYRWAAGGGWQIDLRCSLVNEDGAAFAYRQRGMLPDHGEPSLTTMVSQLDSRLTARHVAPSPYRCGACGLPHPQVEVLPYLDMVICLPCAENSGIAALADAASRRRTVLALMPPEEAPHAPAPRPLNA